MTDATERLDAAISKAQWANAMAAIGLAFQVLATQREHYEGLLQQFDFATGAGAVLDPGLFRQIERNRQRLAPQLTMARAALDFVKSLEPVIASLPKGEP